MIQKSCKLSILILFPNVIFPSCSKLYHFSTIIVNIKRIQNLTEIFYKEIFADVFF